MNIEQVSAKHQVKPKLRTGPHSWAEDELPPHSILLDQVRDVLIIRDLEDRIRFWNKGAENLYGWRADEVVGQNMYDILFAERVESLDSQARCLANTREWSGELRQVTKSRANIVVESHWKLWLDETSRPQFVLIVNRDITETKKLESEILRAQRIEMVGKLASGLAHDFNNTLSTMMILMHKLKEEHLDIKDQSDLEAWQFSGQHAAKLITQLCTDLEEEHTCFGV